MTWWSWLLEIVGLGILAASIGLLVKQSLERRPLRSWSLLVSAGMALLSLVLFAALAPAGPPAWTSIVLAVLGLCSGAAVSLTVAFERSGEGITSSHNHWHMVVWMSFLFVSSILVIAGSTASKVAVCLAVVSSAAVAGYSAALFARSVRIVSRNVSGATASMMVPTAGSTTFCASCGVRLPQGVSRFCPICGAQLLR